MKSYLKSAKKIVGIKTPKKASVVEIDADDEIDVDHSSAKDLTSFYDSEEAHIMSNYKDAKDLEIDDDSQMLTKRTMTSD